MVYIHGILNIKTDLVEQKQQITIYDYYMVR